MVGSFLVPMGAFSKAGKAATFLTGKAGKGGAATEKFIQKSLTKKPVKLGALGVNAAASDALLTNDHYQAVEDIMENEDAAGPTSITLNNARSLGLHLTHIFVHHPPLSKEKETHQRMRGSSALFNRSDAVINLAIDDDFESVKGTKPAEGTNWLRMTTESQYGGKKRSGRKHTVNGLYFIEKVYSVDEFGESETALVMERELSGISRPVLDVVNILGRAEMTPKQFREEWNRIHTNNQIAADNTIRAKLDAAVKAGQVVKLKDPNSARGSIYKASSPDGFLTSQNANTSTVVYSGF
jgi:hypothetical protein